VYFFGTYHWLKCGTLRMVRPYAGIAFFCAWACIAIGVLGEEEAVADAPPSYKYLRDDSLRAYLDFDDAYEDSAR
jgi:hypothetical protein